MTTDTANFTVGDNFGPAMVDMAREMAWETGTFNDGVVFLLDAFVGINSRQAKDIINGNKTIIARNQFVDDNWQPPVTDNMKPELDQFYETVQEAWWEFCDKPHGLFTIGSDKYWLKQVQFSMLLSAKSFIQIIEKYNIKKAHWEMSQILRDIDDCKYETVLEDQGLIKYAGRTDVEGELLTPEQIKRQVKFAERMLEGKENIEEIAEDGIQLIDDTKELSYREGWLSPDGKWYKCKSFQHISLAEKIVDKFGLAVGNTEQDLMKTYGWWKCSSNRWQNLSGRKITQKQIDFLMDWLEKFSDDKETLEINWHGMTISFKEFLEDVEIVAKDEICWSGY